jgi:hypothetical protein
MSGIGVLMVVLPALSMVASFLDGQVWVTLNDVRVGLIFLGLIVLVVTSALQRREANRRA